MELRERKLLDQVYKLYAEYTAKEIGWAIGHYRAEQQALEEQQRIREEIAALEAKLE